MKKGTKITLAIVGVAVVATAGFLVWKNNKNKQLEKEQKERDAENSSSSSSSSEPAKSKYPKTPFKNSTEGNLFRVWVNNTYPIYAKSILLDRSGKYDNDYVRKAYAKYGSDYSKLAVIKEVVAKMGKSASLEENYAQAKFNDGANRVTFYTDGNYSIVKMFYGIPSSTVQKGTFTHGGQHLKVTSGVNKGKVFENGSVWTNIKNAIK